MKALEELYALPGGKKWATKYIKVVNNMHIFDAIERAQSTDPEAYDQYVKYIEDRMITKIGYKAAKQYSIKGIEARHSFSGAIELNFKLMVISDEPTPTD